MNILGIDTSGREGSVALGRGEAGTFEVLEFRALAGGMYSAELVPRIAEVLAARGLTNADVDVFAVCSGPGSFTGLRVGLSAMKALAEVLGKPLVASTVLEAICVESAASGSGGTLVAVLDAQRGEVFCGEYEVEGTVARRVAELLMPQGEFVEWAKRREQVPVFSPDAGLVAKMKEGGVTVREMKRPAADVYARIGMQKYLAGVTVAAEELDADYIRRSDAEIFSKPNK